MKTVVVGAVVCGINVGGKLVGVPHFHEDGEQDRGDVETQVALSGVRVHDVAEVAQNGVVFLGVRVRPVPRILNQGIH